jgi:hypothetical protein
MNTNPSSKDRLFASTLAANDEYMGNSNWCLEFACLNHEQRLLNAVSKGFIMSFWPRTLCSRQQTGNDRCAPGESPLCNA